MAGEFDATVRVLVCQNCGAALPPAQATGGQITCTYCHTVTMITARDDRPLGGGPVDEAQRMAGLWAQVGSAGLAVHQEVAGLMEGGRLPDANLNAARQMWQATCQRQVADPASAGDDLLWLTSALSDYYGIRGDATTGRALWESIMDICHAPRMQQYIRCSLSRNAAKAGDLAAAQGWLGPCDSQPPDLMSDSVYRLAYSVIMTLRGDFQAVLNALGPRMDSIPLFFAPSVLICVVRANAVEKLGDVAGATGQLGLLIQTDPNLKAMLPILATTNAHLALCPQSMPAALAR